MHLSTLYLYAKTKKKYRSRSLRRKRYIQSYPSYFIIKLQETNIYK